jgi:hypothetical protein
MPTLPKSEQTRRAELPPHKVGPGLPLSERPEQVAVTADKGNSNA